jgi:hypothetical protein
MGQLFTTPSPQKNVVCPLFPLSRQWRVSRNPERSTFTQGLQWRLDHQLGKTGKLFTTQSPQKNVVCPLFPPDFRTGGDCNIMNK